MKKVAVGRLSAASAALTSKSIVEKKWIPQNIVNKIFRSFPKGTAPGPTGTRGTHILNEIQVHHQTDALEILTAFVNHMPLGKSPLTPSHTLPGHSLLGYLSTTN